MKVVCINGNFTNHPTTRGVKMPKIGDEDVVLHSQTVNITQTFGNESFKCNGTYYLLDRPEYVSRRIYLAAINFVTLPNATADEMQEAEQESIIM